jgi:NAD(P)-dependent dehydrogenase (short-subunit alcohol dehydrogenase family)
MASISVTGASKGIRMATALVLGRAGHIVYATMRNPSAATELAQTAEKEGLPITVSAMDVDSDTSVTEAICTIAKANRPLDVLVNNAGIERRGSTEELDLSHFRAVMETNYFGALRCIQAVLPQMRARKSGCIINVTLVAGRISASPLGPYAASKFALEGLSEALAQEAKLFNIRVAIVQPGIIDTAMARRVGDPASHLALPAHAPDGGSIHRVAAQPGITIPGRAEDSRHYRERYLATAASHWTRCRALPAMACLHDR